MITQSLHFSQFLLADSYENGMSSLSAANKSCMDGTDLNDSDIEYIQGVLDDSSDEDFDAIE